MKSENINTLNNVLDNIRKAESALNDQKETTSTSVASHLSAAIERYLINIGEDLKGISTCEEGEYIGKNITDFSKIKGTRDILAHKYNDLDTRIIDGIINKNLPILKKEIEQLLKTAGE